MKIIIFFSISLMSFSGLSQADFSKKTDLANCIVENGINLMNTPYQSGTLDINKTEKLVCISNKFDCVTFVEYVLALSIYQAYNCQSKSMEEILTSIRYRNGIIDGYTSRIHYFSEWISQQEKNGWAKDVTQEMGGKKDLLKINYISKHLDKYPKLKTKIDIDKIKETEQMLSNVSRYYIPKDSVANIAPKIQSGDIIAITTSIAGLDFSHTGIAIKKSDDLYLLHASETEKKVLLSHQPLHLYLKNNPKQKGIVVIRPK